MQQNVLIISNLSSATSIGFGRTIRVITEMGHIPHPVLTGFDTSPGKKTDAGEQTLLPRELVAAQLQRTLDNRIINAVMVGATGLSDAQKDMALALGEYKKKRLIPIVANPCLPIDENDPGQLTDSVTDFMRDIAPLADLITPSVREAEALTGMIIDTPEMMIKAAEKLLADGCHTVFMHAGDFQENQTTYQLVTPSAQLAFSAPRLVRKIVDRRRGYGSVLASALAVCLGKGQNYEMGIERALVQMKRMALSEM